MNNIKKSRFAFAAYILLFGLLLPTGAWTGDVYKLTENCNDCHGKDGVSKDGDIPIIAGLSSQYIIDSMKNYKKKDRPCPKGEYQTGNKKGKKSDMCTISKDVSDTEVTQLAHHYSTKKFVPAQQKFDAALAAKGKKIHKKKCEKCHTDGGTLPDDDNGILAGQWMIYLHNSINEFRTGKRPMPKKMKPKMEKLKQEDFDALVNYYGSFK